MGQGTESCGGYEVDYEPHRDGLATGHWVQRDGSTIHVNRMSVRHMKNAKRLCESMADRATFSDDANVWLEWSDVFGQALAEKWKKQHTRPGAPKKSSAPRGLKTLMVCHCGTEYYARNADLARGWAKSCSKSCAATRRDFGRPAAHKKQTGDTQ